MTNIYKITKDLCLERCSDALKEYIGPGKTYSYAHAAELLGMEECTVVSHVSGRATPDMAKLLRYCALLRERFANRILRLAGLDGSRSQIVGEVNPHEISAEVAEFCACITDALRDGKVDHREMGHVLRELRDVLTVGEAFMSRHDRGPCTLEIEDDDGSLVGRVMPRETTGRLDS